MDSRYFDVMLEVCAVLLPAICFACAVIMAADYIDTGSEMALYAMTLDIIFAASVMYLLRKEMPRYA